MAKTVPQIVVCIADNALRMRALFGHLHYVRIEMHTATWRRIVEFYVDSPISLKQLVFKKPVDRLVEDRFRDCPPFMGLPVNLVDAIELDEVRLTNEHPNNKILTNVDPVTGVTTIHARKSNAWPGNSQPHFN